MINNRLQTEFKRDVLQPLAGIRRHLRGYLLLQGLAVVCPLLLLAAMISLGIDYTFHLNRDMRAVQLLILLALAGYFLYRFCIQPLLIPMNNTDLARLVEHKHPHLQSRLLSAVAFTDPHAEPADSRCSTSLVETVLRQAATQARELPWPTILPRRKPKQYALVIAAGLLAAFFPVLLIPTTMNLWFRRNILLADTAWPQINALTVEGLQNNRLLVARNDDLQIAARVVENFEPPRQVYITYTVAGDTQQTAQMPRREGQPVRFTHIFENLKDNLKCRITGGDADTGWFTVQVIDRPRIRTLTLNINPPTYTNLENYALPNAQTVAEVPAGSHVIFKIKTNKPVAQAELIRRINNEDQNLGPADLIDLQTITANDQPSQTADYYLYLTDQYRFANIDGPVPPVIMTARLLEDQPPQIKLTAEGAGDIITPQAVLPLEIEITDTFGLGAADLVYEITDKQKQQQFESLKDLTPGIKNFEHVQYWSADKHQLKTGQQLRLLIRATDQDNINGPNVGRSSSLNFRVVSKEELLSELNRREQEYRRDFERLTRMQEDLFSGLLSLFSQADEQDQSTEAQIRRLRELTRRQRDYAGRVRSIQGQFQRLLTEMRINRLADAPVERRLTENIITPLGHLCDNQLAEAQKQLEQLTAPAAAEQRRLARQTQQALLGEMNRILEHMLKLEGFQEAVILLRDVIQLQQELNKETEQKIEQEIFGIPTQPESSKQ